jgi:DNA-directed RNA polymerase subunit RPC12/RpoP
MNPIRLDKYRCTDCGDLHSDEDEAIECCGDEVMVVDETIWKCADCGDEYDDEEMARYCCYDGDEPLPPTPAQLEAAGQQRLAL